MDRFNDVKPRFDELADEHELAENWLSGAGMGSSGSTSTGCVPKACLETIKVLLGDTTCLPTRCHAMPAAVTPAYSSSWGWPVIVLGAAER